MASHRDSNSRLYNIWRMMKNRCSNSNVDAFPDYGGKGIRVCSEWQKYSVFQEWSLSNGYASTLSIDRKNSALDYSPSNCRWVSYSEQCINRKKFKNNTSGFTGVTFHAKLNKWRSVINYDKKRINIGCYDTPEDAAQARNDYIDLHGLTHKKAVI
ncbi:HNH endonuclease [Vibrio phage 1.097.O._10N.286.49.B3]|uniref:DNA-binding domain protein n=1 Tax=Vibrio phage 1.097.O._10N.286.49.B3 TaxID=1881383 RepID=A0A2I7R0L2_9CAUD|nr:HNH endonuclease [Vibrio phage 1.097.O._10N.286.49.B3]AUR87178.1 DNA-binding domain protein [Vibrio phage 1.097.O._10N.286.49.B3]